MDSAFHQLCSRYSGTLTPTTPMAVRLGEDFTVLVLPCSFTRSSFAMVCQFVHRQKKFRKEILFPLLRREAEVNMTRLFPLKVYLFTSTPGYGRKEEKGIDTISP